MRYRETKGVLFNMRQELAALVDKRDRLIDELIDSSMDKFEGKLRELNEARIAVVRKSTELQEAENKAYNMKKVRRS